MGSVIRLLVLLLLNPLALFVATITILAVAITILVFLRQQQFYLLVWIPLLVNFSVWIYSGAIWLSELRAKGGSGPGSGGDFSPLLFLLFYSPAIPILLAIFCVPPRSEHWDLKSLAISLAIAIPGALAVIGMTLAIGSSLDLL